jgi:hypothetical protein
MSTFLRFVAIGLNTGLDLGQREEGGERVGNGQSWVEIYPQCQAPLSLRRPRARLIINKVKSIANEPQLLYETLWPTLWTVPELSWFRKR